MKIKTGGSAFPEIYTDAKVNEHNQEYGDTYSVGGMTLRDYFSAKAMQGVLSSPDLKSEIQNNPQWVAALSFRFADAMIRERDKDGTE